MRAALAGLLALAALAVPVRAAAQVPAPRLAARAIAQLPRPLPAPYVAGDAKPAIAAAARRARAANKRLLLDFGANWCVDCRVLAGVFALPQMRPWLARHFELVTIDVGRFDANLDVAARFGVDLGAVPAVLIVDPRSGRLLNRGDELGLGDAGTMQPQQMADWLARWASP